ncbi:MAG: hypothetical protein JWR03_1302 [Cohnella sp.]|nr:hypothetical protein [Cohnella sp.]
MSEYGTTLYSWTGWLTQFLLAFAGFAAILRLTTIRRTRWRISLRGWRRRDVPVWFLKLGGAAREGVTLQERRILLSGCGLRIDPRLYLTGRRMLICFLALAAVISWGAQAAGLFSSLLGWNVLFASVLLAMAAYFDNLWLQALRRYRTDRIRRELAVVSSQLLYYTGSRLHLHGKLMRCLPLTRLIRVEMGLLLNEWYHDADRALQQFKERLGSDEAYGFTESIRSLRLNETEEVYDLLREMVREYKTKIELAKDGRKETASYLLFVLSGIPILYTFQIFLYPWVQEAARLFKALNP